VYSIQLSRNEKKGVEKCVKYGGATSHLYLTLNNESFSHPLLVNSISVRNHTNV